MNNYSIVLHYQQNYRYDIPSLVIWSINRIRSLINVAESLLLLYIQIGKEIMENISSDTNYSDKHDEIDKYD